LIVLSADTFLNTISKSTPFALLGLDVSKRKTFIVFCIFAASFAAASAFFLALLNVF
jgi:hypothetical protein